MNTGKVAIEKQGSEGISRRGFLLAGATATAVGAGYLISGCTPSTGGTADDNSAAIDGSKDTASVEQSSALSFYTPPAPIADSAITQTVEADFVIVGGGIGGLTAALSASDEKARVVVLEKAKVSRTGGSDIAAIGSSIQAANKVDLKPDEMIQRYIKHTDGYVNQQLLATWIHESGKIIDRLLEISLPAGVEATMKILPYPTPDWNPAAHMIEIWPTAHGFAPLGEFGDNMEVLVEPLTAYLKEHGVEFYYETPGVQLIQDDNKAVVGVIGQTADGSYIKVSASKGVLLSTGDFANDPEMMRAYIQPDLVALSAATNAYTNYMKEENRPDPEHPLNTGDGHKMALWVGAVMEESPHSTMTVSMASVPSPFLQVNGNGERFHNEDVQILDEFYRQPGKTVYAIYDSKWQADYDKAICWEMWGPPPVDGTNYSATADTIEELADKIGVPPENLKATVNRRNALAELGQDIDFGLEAHRVTSVIEPPFYAAEFGSSYFSSTLSGIRVNGNSQVLNSDFLPIKGLYAAGNVVGERFNTAYTTYFPGLTNGFACSTGWAAAKHALQA